MILAYVLRLQPVKHEAVHSLVVKFGVGCTEKLAEGKGIFGGVRSVTGLSGPARVVVGGAVGGRRVPPVLVVGQVTQCGRLVSVAQLLVGRHGA